MVTCPKCGNADKSEKVSGVVGTGAGTASLSGPTGGATYSDGKRGNGGGYTTINGRQSTDLAKMLAPPAEPSSTSPYSRQQGKFWLYLFWPALVGLSFGGLAILGSLLSFTGGRPLEGLLSLVLGVCLLASVRVVFMRLREWNRRKQQALQVLCKAEYREWRMAMTRWERLYYCSLDDLVYDPNTGENRRPQEMAGWIYDASSR
jgi:hypothetical protein